MTSNDEPRAAVQGRAWSPLLLASLALNLAVAGAVAGTVLAHRGHSVPREFAMAQFGGGEQGLHGFVKSLPKERRAVFRALAEKTRQSIRPLRQAVRAAREEAANALRADPFDPQRFEKALGDVVTAESAARRAGVLILSGAVQQMTAAERAQFDAWRRQHEQPGQPKPADRAEPEAQPAPPPPAPR